MGTHFNVNAYPDEAFIATTLVQGSVQVVSGQTSKRLTPGKKAEVTGDQITIHAADVDKETAWKNGIFDFNGSTLQEILRQISNWYDVEVVYTGKAPQRQFAGQIGRDLMLSEVLKGLEAMGVKFRMEGKKLYVN